MILSILEMYEASIQYECTFTAHYIFHLLREGLVMLDDDISKIDQITVDKSIIDELTEQNYLGFNQVKVFALKLDDYLFAFIFAKDRQEAIDFCQKQLRKKPRNCNEYPFYFSMSRGKEFLTFQDMKKEHSSFPAVIGFYEREAVYQ